jgi:hypothetical protein
VSVRDILDYQGNKCGELDLPDDTTDEVWSQKLAQYSKAPPNATIQLLDFSIKRRKDYAEDLLERFKLKNITEGVNALQGLWMQHRMRAVDITFMGVPMTIDVLNLAISGDIEIACLTLLSCTPDDMSQPFHWMNQDRINWLVADMKSFLGWK